MENQSLDIHARLEKLERENRQMKRLGIVLAVLASTFFISGQAHINKTIDANEFVLKDGNGKVRARLSMQTDKPSLFFYDDKGGIPLSLSGGDEPFVNLIRVGTEETVTLGANRGFCGVGIYEKNIRAGLSIQKGVPGLELYDAQGKPRAAINATEDRASIYLNNAQHKMASTMWAEEDGSGIGVIGSTGIFRVNFGGVIGGPVMSIEDKEGYSTQIGSSDLVVPKTGRTERTSAASVVLFDKDKKVLWSAP